MEEDKANTPEAAAAAAPGRRKRPIAIPKDSASFFRARAKDPAMFQFTAKGDLQVPEMKGEAAKVIELPYYRASTPEERQEAEDELRRKLEGIEKEYDETLQQLKDSLREWRISGAASEVVKLQRDLARLDALRSQYRSPVRWTTLVGGLEIREVLLDQIYEKKKMETVNLLRLRSLPLQELVRIGTEGAASPVAAAAAAAPVPEATEQEESFVLFGNPEDPEHGLLSPDTPLEFIYNSTKYTSPTQAFEGERLTKLNRKDLRPLLLRIRDPEKIRSFATRVTGDVENPRELWIEILRSLITQHPRIVPVLRATGEDTLVYANAKEARWGVGLAVNDPSAMSRESWKGPNVLGQAWMAVREGLPEEEEDEEEDTQRGGSFTEHGRTAEESKKIRVGILKGWAARRRS